MSRDDSALFVNSAGEKDTNIGRSVTYFFGRTLNLHITTTAIRSLIETNAEDALQSSRITTTDRIAISNMNGHSSQTVRDYYLKQSTERNVKNAIRAFSQLGAVNITPINNQYHDSTNSRNHIENNNVNSYSNSQITIDYDNDGNDDYDNDVDYSEHDISYNNTNDDNDVNHSEHDISYNNTNFKTNLNDDLREDDDDDDDDEEENTIHWGLNHPDYGLALDKRARWSKAELKYIKRWIKHDRASNSINHHYWPASRCLKQVRSDPEAKTIFHQRHILKSDRLRVGLETCLKLLNLK